jgi:arsenate reductase-like glutaredoxin family protein
LKKKINKGKSIVKMAQEFVAKKCGILQDNQDLDNIKL